MSKKKTNAAETTPALRLEWIEAGQLAENPRNWRRHPPEQTAALRQLIADPEVGWAGVLLYNQRTKRLIDGHARRGAVDAKTKVPVLVGDWSEEAEAKILATLDPLAAMAERDDGALAALAASVEWSDSLEAVFDSLDLATPQDLDPSPKLGDYEYKLVIDCTNEKQQAALLERLEKEGLKVKAMTV